MCTRFIFTPKQDTATNNRPRIPTFKLNNGHRKRWSFVLVLVVCMWFFGLFDGCEIHNHATGPVDVLCIQVLDKNDTGSFFECQFGRSLHFLFGLIRTCVVFNNSLAIMLALHSISSFFRCSLSLMISSARSNPFFRFCSQQEKDHPLQSWLFFGSIQTKKNETNALSYLFFVCWFFLLVFFTIIFSEQTT